MTLTQPNRFLQFLAARGMAPVVPGQQPFTPDTGFGPLPPNPFVPNVNFGAVGPLAPQAPMQTVAVPDSRYGTPTEFVPRFQVPVNLNVPVWQPPPGYIPPNPNVGALVPMGGFPARQSMNPVGNPYPNTPMYNQPGGTNVTASPVQSGGTTGVGSVPGNPGSGGSVPVSGSTRSEASTPSAVPATGPGTSAEPPLIVDPTTTYPVGTPIPVGSVELPWTTEGIRQVKTPDGAIRQVDGSGNLAGSGVVAPTETLTILPSGVVQAPGGTGMAPVLAAPPVPEPTAIDAQPYMAEMTAMGMTPEQYVAWQQGNLQTAQNNLAAIQDEIETQTQWAAQGHPEAQATIDALNQAAAQLAADLPNTRRYADEATAIFNDDSRTVSPEERSAIEANAGTANLPTSGFQVTETPGVLPGSGEIVSAAGAVLDAPRSAAVTGVGGLLLQAANHSGGRAETVQDIATWINPVQSLLDVTFDPIEAATWAEQNPDLVNSAYNNGYDNNGDGTADYTGSRAVWELFAGTQAWYERAGADIVLDPLTYVGGVASIGRRIAGEVPEAAVAATRAVTGAADEVVPAAAEVTQAVNPVRRVVGEALQVPDLVINRAADRVVGGALGLAGDAIRSTPGVSRLFEQSDRVRGEVARDEALAAVDRTTALERRQTEFAANRAATTVAPAEVVPGVNDGVGDAATVTTTTDLLNVTGNPDAIANRRFNEAGEHVDDVVDPLADPAVTPEARPISTAPDAESVAGTNTPSSAANPLDARFREVVNMPWKDGSSRRAELYRAGIITKRVGPDADETTRTAGRKYVELIEAAWRRADDGTKESAAFQREMADAEEVHARTGRRGETSQNLPLAWERASDRAVAAVSGIAREGGVTATRSTLPTSVDRLTVPLGERDRGLLSEVLTTDSRSGAPEETLYDRFRRHTQDALDQGATETEATDRAMRLTGDDFLRSRGIDPTPKSRKGLGWWDNLSGKIATGMLYKPTTLLRRVIGDTITDVGNLGIARKWSALSLAADPKLSAEGYRAQQGTRSVDLAFGNSEASRIIADTGSGTRWRAELSQERASVDRATGRRAPTPARQQEIAGDDPEVRSLVDQAKGTAKTVWSEGPKAIINGLGSTRRMAVFADHLATNLPLLYRQTQDQAIDASGRHGFQADDALVSDAFTTLLDRVAAEGRAGFDAVDLREALRTSARNATSDASGRMSVAIEGNIDRWANDVASKYQDGLATLNDDALGEVNRLLFSYRPTNLDEAVSKVFFFHYWMTRQSAFYVTEGMKNPALAANYFRAQEGLERAAEENDYPAPVKGFIKLMGGDLGFALYWNPGALAQTYATFREATPDGDDGRNILETVIERYSPGMLNPLIATTINAAGLLPSGQMTDPLTTGTDRRLFGNAINWARQFDFLPGDDTPELADTPYQNLLNRVRDTASGVLSPFLPGLAEHVEATSGNASRTRQLNDFIVTEARRDNPNDEDAALTEASLALHDPESDLYQRGYRAYTDAQLIGSIANMVIPGQPTVRAASVDRAAGYVETQRENNPTLTNSEIAASDPVFDAAQVERALIPTGNEDATAMVMDQQRAGNVGTPEGRRASNLWNTIALFDDPEQIRAAVPQGVTVGDTTYTPEQIVALPEDTRVNLANDYALAQPDGGAALGDYRTARDEFSADHPRYAQYTDWRNAVRDDADLINTNPDATSDQRLIAWADRQARTNQNFGTWWRDERARIERTVTDPALRDQQLGMSVTSSDGYLTYNGIAPDVYAAEPQPMLGPSTVGGGGESGGRSSTPVDLRAQLDVEAAQYRADIELTNARLREMTGDPDIRYELLIQDPQGGPAARVALERRGFEAPRMGSSLYDYSNWVAEQAPGADISFDTFVRYAASPQASDAEPGDILQSRYGQ